jgi:transposase
MRLSLQQKLNQLNLTTMSLELKAQGHSLRQIATSLGVGYGTVRERLKV